VEKRIMKNFMSFRKHLFAFTALAFGLVIFSSCKKNDGDNNQIPVAGLMAFNLAPNKPAIGFSLSGNSLTNAPLAYTNFTGGYLGVYTGTRSVTAFDANTGTAITTNNDYTFDKDKYYSLFLVGDSTYQNVISNDGIDSLSGATGMAYVRYINAIPDSSHPIVTLAQGGTNTVNENAAFSTVSKFTAFTPGDVAISVNNNGNIQANRTITVEQRKVYTALLIGMPGSSDTSKAVQIKYIENGTLSADSTAQQGFVKKSAKAINIQ